MSISKLDKAIFNIRVKKKEKSIFSYANIDFGGSKIVNFKLIYINMNISFFIIYYKNCPFLNILI